MTTNREILQDAQRAEKLANTQKAEAAVAAVELADVSLIFAFKQFLAVILEGLGHTIMFPIAGGASVIRAILRIREARLEKKENKPSAILKATVETVAALAISTAVVGTFAAEAAFAVIGPIIFTVTLAAKSAFHLGATFYYGIQYLLATQAEKIQDYKDKLKHHLMMTVISALTTVAAGLVLIAHKATFGILGIIGGGLGALYAAYKAFTIQAPKPVVPASALAAPSPSSGPGSSPPEPGLKSSNSKAVSPDQSPQGVGVNTAIILEQTSLVELKEIKQETPEQQKENFKKNLKNELANKKDKIIESVNLLERYVGAFNFKVKDDLKIISITSWENLYQNRYNKQSEAVQKFMHELDSDIRSYNQLVKNNDQIVKEEYLQRDITVAEQIRMGRNQEEEREEKEREERGFTRGDASDLLNALKI